MIYREYLVMRKALGWFAVLLAVMLIVIVVLRERADFVAIAILSGGFAALFASIFGVALGNGSREAAPVLWVLPMERWKLALQVIAVDLVGTTVAFVLAFLALRFGMQMQGRMSGAWIVMALAMAYATYGWSALVGMLGRRMAYCGILALPALMIWMILAQSHLAVGAILRTPIVANPFAVLNTALAVSSWEQHRYALDSVSASLQWLGTAWETPVLVAITVATGGLAVALWQRAQVIR